MGTFRVEITAVGGHGCERTAKEGEKVARCGRVDCPDCLAIQAAKLLAANSCSVEKVVMKHWPDTPHEVWDETKMSGTWALQTDRIKGSF